MERNVENEKTLRDIGEAGVLSRLRDLLRAAPCTAKDSAVLVGPGDDAAVIHPAPGADHDLVLTSDPVIEGVHFEPGTQPAAVGHKAVGRVLSDIAAMGADPAFALVDLVAPPHCPVSKIESLFTAATRLAASFNLAIVGGDMASGPALELHIFGVGRLPHGTAVCRHTATAGEALFVTGTLGGSRREKHLAFAPRVREGAWLRGRASAMIDLSDGLATDARHLADASGVGIRLSGETLPVSEAARHMPGKGTPLEHALYDGEDFELLFTLPSNQAPALEETWQHVFPDCRLNRIGITTNTRGRLEYENADGRVHTIEKHAFSHWTPKS